MTVSTFVNAGQASILRVSLQTGAVSILTCPAVDTPEFLRLPLSHQLRIERKRGIDQLADAAIGTSQILEHDFHTLIANGTSATSLHDPRHGFANPLYRAKREDAYYIPTRGNRRPIFQAGDCFRETRPDRLKRAQNVLESRRTHTSRHGPSRPAQPITPRFNSPSKPNDSSFKPKTPPSVLSRPTNSPLRPSHLEIKKDEMLAGVREVDRQRKEQRVTLNAIEIARRKRPKQLEDLTEAFINETQSLAQQLLSLEADMYLRPLHVLDNYLDRHWLRTRPWALDLAAVYENALSSIRDRSLQTFVEHRIRPIEELLEDIELELYEAHQNCSSIGFVTPSIIRRGAEAKIQIIQQEKSFGRPIKKLWDNIDRLGTTIVQIVEIIRNVTARVANASIPIPHKLAQAYAVGLCLARPYGQNESTLRWSVHVLSMAHIIREIEMYRADANVLPVLTFAKRWGSLTAHRYGFPLRDASRELRESLDITKEGSREFKHKMWSRSLHMLKEETIMFTVNNEKIVDEYWNLIYGGFTSLCPHSMRDFHLDTVSLFKPVDSLYQTMDHLKSEMLDARATILNFQGLNRNPVEERCRANIVKKIDYILDWTHDENHPFSRRSFRDITFRFLVWHGAQLLTSGISPRRNIRSMRDRDEDGRWARTTPELSKLPVTTIPVRWLKNRSFYPNSSTIMIDYVTNINTCLQVFEQIQSNDIVSFDIITSSYKQPLQRTMEYILLASDTNVYILDAQALLYKAQFKMLLKHLGDILQNPSILKICIHPETVTSLLWQKLSIDLKNVHHLTPDLSKAWSFERLMSMVEQVFRVNKNFSEDLAPRLRFVKDKKFFLYLAMRAYAPLRLFHALNQQTSVQTFDSAAIYSLKNYYNRVRHELDQREFGPINIDRLYKASSSLESDAGPRKDYMKDLSLTEARITLRDFPKSKVSRHPRKTRLVTRYQIEKERNVAAYYLFTMFGETLGKISEYFHPFKNPAGSILSAADEYELRLNEEDRVKLGQAAEDVESAEIIEMDSRPEDNTQPDDHIPEGQQIKQQGREQEPKQVFADNSFPSKLSEQTKVVFAQIASTQGESMTNFSPMTAGEEPKVVDQSKERTAESTTRRSRPTSGRKSRTRKTSSGVNNVIRKVELASGKVKSHPSPRPEHTRSSTPPFHHAPLASYQSAKLMDLLETGGRQRRSNSSLVKKIPGEDKEEGSRRKP